MHCSDEEHDVLQSIESEEDLSGVLKAGHVLLLGSARRTELRDTISPMCSPDVDDGLTFIKSERQQPETKLEEKNLPLDNTNQEETWSDNESKTHVKEKSEKVESEDSSSNSGETRHWVVCHDGVLKEVKVEPTDWIPDTTGTTNDDVVTEHEKIHGEVKPYTCVTCGKTFRYVSGLSVHERSHKNVKPFTCDTCGKSFTQSGNLNIHQRIHTNVKPYTCVTCGKSFTLSGSLKTHERIHNGVKPYACSTCGKSFTMSGNLKTHQRIHTGVKPYTCSTCEKSFRQLSSLTAHEMIHTNVKPFICRTCGKSFKLSGYLLKHELIHTKLIPVDVDTLRKSVT